MSFRKLILIFSAFAALAISCKKDDDGVVKPGLTGTMQITGLPEFIAPGQRCTLTVKGATHPEGKELNYFWKILPTQTKYDTTYTSTNYIHTFADTLCTFTVYCYAYAEGYSSNSTYVYTSTMRAGRNGSITGVDYPTEMVKDQYVAKIGNQTWTVNNVSEPAYGEGFRNSEIMSGIFGRYYNYNEAIEACNSLGQGWTLPTLEDWQELETYVEANKGTSKTIAAALMGNASLNGTVMWDYWPAVGEITNTSEFAALPVGYANLASNIFEGLYEYSIFWTATTNPTNESMAYYKYMIYNQPDVYVGSADKDSFGASVRCIRK